MYNTRTRMLSFRLSEDEYERLKEMSIIERARSVSDFARSTLCSLPGRRGIDSQDLAGARLDMLEGEVQRLRADLQNLSQAVEAIRGQCQDVWENERATFGAVGNG